MAEMRTIPSRETISVEFKSDARRLPDSDLVQSVVCLANTEGGEIYLGVEDDGRVTGLHSAHDDMPGMAALISNRTTPPVSVRVERIVEGGKPVARIEVPKSPRLVATTEGLLQRRRLRADGTPECVPFLPHEFVSRQAEFGLLDPSAIPLRQASVDDLDPDERRRLRAAIERFGGDRSLLPLGDEEFDAALGLVRRHEGRRVPTVAGILLLGREGALREHVPTHEVAFQVLEGPEVRVNEFLRAPLVRTIERIEELFAARVTEREVQVGLFRVPVPLVDRRAFRESVANALTHRDYARLGAVHVRWDDEAVTVSSPGGFVEGVTLENLITVEPHPRNPALADAFKRLGLVERTGRGVDLIYQGLLRYGRPAPDYGRSDRTTVVVRLSRAEADLAFFELILEEEKKAGAPLPLDVIMSLALLQSERRVDVTAIAKGIQKDEAAARRVLERLVEAGLAEAHGVKRGRTYTLSAAVYRRLGAGGEYVRQAGFDALQQEQMVLAYVDRHGSIRRRDVAVLCRISDDQAKRLLKRLVTDGRLVKSGERKGSTYGRGLKLMGAPAIDMGGAHKMPRTELAEGSSEE